MKKRLAIVYFLCVYYTLSTVAFAQAVVVSNNTSAAVNVSWFSESGVAGEVHYSTSADLSDARTAYDARGRSYEGCTHYVDIKNLKNNTTYYFEVVSGGDVDDNSGEYYTFRTMDDLSAPPGICLAWGRVYKADGSTPLEGAIAYITLVHNGAESYPLAKLTDRNGRFLVNLKEARSVETDNLFSAISRGDIIKLKAVYCKGTIVSDEFSYEGCAKELGHETTTTTIKNEPSSGGGSGGGSSAPVVSDGECREDSDCDDGKFCNGREQCVSGRCKQGSNPCSDNEACYERGDACIPVGGGEPAQDKKTCSSNSDCDNGLFCDGAEGCVDGKCVTGTSPCASGDVCMEEMDTCWGTEKIKAMSVKKTLKRPFFRKRKCTWLVLKAGRDTHFDPSLSSITFSGPERISSGVVVDTSRSVYSARGFIFVPVCVERDASKGVWTVKINTSIREGIKALDEGIEAEFKII